jgi:hypothetical protein
MMAACSPACRARQHNQNPSKQTPLSRLSRSRSRSPKGGAHHLDLDPAEGDLDLDLDPDPAARADRIVVARFAEGREATEV